jgi:hypothetical protein
MPAHISAMSAIVRRSKRCWRQSRADFGQIRGVVHAAMVVDDGLVGNLTAERIAAVLARRWTARVTSTG